MTPLEFLARLAALVPPPRYPLLRYLGVLGPRSAWRRDIAPSPRGAAVCAEALSADERSHSPPPGTPRRVPKESSATAVESSRSRREATGPSKPASHRPREDRAIVPVSPGAAAPARTGAVMLAPNIVSVAHWDRLLGGVLYAATPRVGWATLLRRSFGVDVFACARCGGRLGVVGEVTEPATVHVLLERLGLPTEAPRAARARDPTDLLGESASG